MSHHDELERLLPWYVNGTLGEAEMDRLNRHLAGCDRCAGRIREEIRLALTWRQAPAGDARIPAADQAWAGLASCLPRREPRRGRPAVLLAALCLAVASGAFLLGQLVQPSAYRTLSRPVTHDGPVIQLVVTPGAEAQTLHLIETTGGTVLRGSGPGGIYRVGLRPGADTARLIARLERLPEVRWVAREQP